MRIHLPLLACSVLLCAACAPNSASSPSKAQLEQQCGERLHGSDNKRAGADIARFCSCFVDAALKKVPAGKIASQFAGNDDPQLQQQLDADLEQCNVLILPAQESAKPAQSP